MVEGHYLLHGISFRLYFPSASYNWYHENFLPQFNSSVNEFHKLRAKKTTSETEIIWHKTNKHKTNLKSLKWENMQHHLKLMCLGNECSHFAYCLIIIILTILYSFSEIVKLAILSCYILIIKTSTNGTFRCFILLFNVQ